MQSNYNSLCQQFWSLSSQVRDSPDHRRLESALKVLKPYYPYFRRGPGYRYNGWGEAKKPPPPSLTLPFVSDDNETW